MNDIIRKAVELADGWEFCLSIIIDHPNDFVVESVSGYRGALPATPELMDALAAQLVRQVDALMDYTLEIDHDEAILGYSAIGEAEIVAGAVGPDRTMNTIKTIVDSEVLE